MVDTSTINLLLVGISISSLYRIVDVLERYKSINLRQALHHILGSQYPFKCHS